MDSFAVVVDDFVGFVCFLYSSLSAGHNHCSNPTRN